MGAASLSIFIMLGPQPPTTPLPPGAKGHIILLIHLQTGVHVVEVSSLSLIQYVLSPEQEMLTAKME